MGVWVGGGGGGGHVSRHRQGAYRQDPGGNRIGSPAVMRQEALPTYSMPLRTARTACAIRTGADQVCERSGS